MLKTSVKLAINLREKLGESLNSLQRFDAPLEVTTSSLEAPQSLFTSSSTNRAVAKWLEAMEHYKHAIELDLNSRLRLQRIGSELRQHWAAQTGG